MYVLHEWLCSSQQCLCEQVVALRQCYHVVCEKEILMSVNCTFVVKMYHAFKVSSNLAVRVTSGGYHNVRRNTSEDCLSDTGNKTVTRVFILLTGALLCRDYKVT